MSAFRLAVVSLVDIREFPVIQDPEFRLAGVSLVDGRSSVSETVFRLAVVSLVDGHEFPAV